MLFELDVCVRKVQRQNKQLRESDLVRLGVAFCEATIVNT